MKIGVCVKAVPDSESAIRLSEDMKKIVSEGLKYVINPYDEYALEEALRYKDKNPCEVVVLTIGNMYALETINQALAMGADRSILVVNEDDKDLDTLGTAKIISKIVCNEGLDAIYMGRQSIDNSSHEVSSMVAEILEWSQATNVIGIEYKEDRITAVREGDSGQHEILLLRMPFLVGVTKGINEPRYPSLKGIMSAKKKEIKKIPLGELGLVDEKLSGITIEKIELVKIDKKCEMIDGDADQAAFKLVKKLREDLKCI